jgi:hypothetical protein
MLTIEEVLVSINSNRLKELRQALKMKPMPRLKQECVDALMKVYADEENIWRFYDQVSTGEKKLIDLYVWNKRNPDREAVKRIAEESEKPAWQPRIRSYDVYTIKVDSRIAVSV